MQHMLKHADSYLKLSNYCGSNNCRNTANYNIYQEAEYTNFVFHSYRVSSHKPLGILPIAAISIRKISVYNRLWFNDENDTTLAKHWYFLNSSTDQS